MLKDAAGLTPGLRQGLLSVICELFHFLVACAFFAGAISPALALHFLLSGLGLLFFGPEGSRTAPLASGMFELAEGFTVSGQVVLMVASAIVLSGLFFLVFERTVAGKALRATAVNRLGARLMGISTNSAGQLTFALAAFIGGLSGLLIGPTTTIFYDPGFLIGLKGFVAAVIAGLASYPGALIGALSVGAIEAFGSFWASAFKVWPDASRVARPLGSATKVGSRLSQPSGSSRRSMR